MSEEATLFLLKEKLNEIKTKRRISWIGSIVIGLLIAIGLEVFRVEHTTSFFAGGAVGFIIVSFLDDYYRKQKDAIIQQIEHMASRKVV